MSIAQLAPATTYPALLGYVLLHLRRQARLKQEVMAEGMGLSPSTLSRIERGEIALTVEQLARAAEVLKTSPNAIVALADRAAKAAQKQGLRVQNERFDNPLAVGVVVVGVAVLTALLAAALTGKSDR